MHALQQPDASLVVTLEAGESLVVEDAEVVSTIDGPVTFVDHPRPGLPVRQALAKAGVAITPDLAAYAKQRRDATEAAGITVNGLAVASAPDDQMRVNNAYNGMLVTGAPSIRFKAASGFIVLTLEQVKAVGSALFAHTQACFDAEDQVDAALAAAPPTITTPAQVDAVFAAVPAAY